MKAWFKGDAKEQFKMDFLTCSEVSGYKSIAEVEKEELESKVLDTKREDAQLMVDAGILTPERASELFKVPREAILPKSR